MASNNDFAPRPFLDLTQSTAASPAAAAQAAQAIVDRMQGSGGARGSNPQHELESRRDMLRGRLSGGLSNYFDQAKQLNPAGTYSPGGNDWVWYTGGSPFPVNERAQRVMALGSLATNLARAPQIFKQAAQDKAELAQVQKQLEELKKKQQAEAEKAQKAGATVPAQPETVDQQAFDQQYMNPEDYQRQYGGAETPAPSPATPPLAAPPSADLGPLEGDWSNPTYDIEGGGLGGGSQVPITPFNPAAPPPLGARMTPADVAIARHIGTTRGLFG